VAVRDDSDREELCAVGNQYTDLRMRRLTGRIEEFVQWAVRDDSDREELCAVGNQYTKRKKVENYMKSGFCVV